jgi:hypothetical protein
MGVSVLLLLAGEVSCRVRIGDTTLRGGPRLTPEKPPDEAAFEKYSPALLFCGFRSFGVPHFNIGKSAAEAVNYGNVFMVRDFSGKRYRGISLGRCCSREIFIETKPFIF